MRILVLLFFCVRAAALDFAFVGDSICEGYPSNRTIFSTGGLLVVTNYNIASLVELQSAGRLSATNFGKAGAGIGNVSAVQLEAALALRPRFVYQHVLVNNISSGDSWATVLTSLNSIAAKCAQSNVTYVVNDIFPWTSGSDGYAATIREWNTNLTIWAATSGVLRTSFHDNFATNRISTGQLDNMIPAYTSDGIHLTPDGYTNWARLLIDWEIGPRIRVNTLTVIQ